jgi:hypothetical protein
VLNEVESNDKKTNFDETLCELKDDPSALSNHIANLLATQINGNLRDEIQYYRQIQALFPIISILFNDKTKVEIFVQINNNKKSSQGDSNSHEHITGVREKNI